MTSPLLSARDEAGAVVSVERLAGGMVEVSARLPHLAATAQPGQFAQLRCGDRTTPLLRRPFSVAWTEGELASFVFAPVGVGTHLLARLQAGDVLQTLGPLGTGFSLEVSARRWLCVAGGLGCAPFPLLLRALRSRGAEDVRVISGAGTADRLYPPGRFQRGDEGVAVDEVTIDGSRGAAGLVTDAVRSYCNGDTAVFACGPNAMLAALHSTLLRKETRPASAQASLEAAMGCGYGTCLGCALPVRENGVVAWELCCRQGPVMDMDRVAWDQLMAMPPAHVA